MFEDLVPLAAITLIFGIPIVAILTAHQRKMAELLNRPPQGQAMNNPEVSQLRYEVSELKQRMDQQTIILDDLRSHLISAKPPEEPLQDRLQQK
jgi:hypothetical protein